VLGFFQFKVRTSPVGFDEKGWRGILFLRRTYDLIVTFIRHDPNQRIRRSFLIQILKFGREAH